MKNITPIILVTLAFLTAGCNKYRSSFTLTYSNAAIIGFRTKSNMRSNVPLACVVRLQTEDYWFNYFALEMKIDLAAARKIRESFFAMPSKVSKRGDEVHCVVKTSFGRDDAEKLRCLCISFEKYLNDLETCYRNASMLWLQGKAAECQADLDKLLSEEPQDNAIKRDWVKDVENKKATLKMINERFADFEGKPSKVFRIKMN